MTWSYNYYQHVFWIKLTLLKPLLAENNIFYCTVGLLMEKVVDSLIGPL